MKTITFLEVDPDDTAIVLEKFPQAMMHQRVLADDALIEACKDSAVVSCFIYSKFTAEILAKLPNLRLLCTRSVGYDHIDTEECKRRGITVCNVPDYGSHVIAEHVFALLLSTLRHIPEGHRKVESGVFDYHGLRGMALRGKTVGIVGTGKIGRKVAEIAYGFEMKILAVDRCRTLELVEKYGVEYTDLPALLRQSDIVTLHVPDTTETTHMINAETIATMKQGVILVNTARGSLIDSPSLLSALKSRHVRYALLDVLEHEETFAKNKELIALPNVVATPHIAFYADDSLRNMYLDTFQSMDQFAEGTVPDHVVRPINVVCDLKGVVKH